MAFDGITVAAVTDELQRSLADGHISKISEPEKDELLINIKTQGGGQKRLLLSAGASLPFVYLTDRNMMSPAVAPAFTMLLRKHLNGGRILSVTQPGLERIINICIEHRDEMGDLRARTLIIELMGKYSNIIFTEEDGTIIDSIKRVPASMSSVREVLPGKKYFIPETQDKIDPLSDITYEIFSDAVFSRAGNIIKSVYGTFTGISPVMASETACRAGLDGNMSNASLSEEQKKKLFRCFMSVIDDVRDKNFSPVIIYDGSVPKEFSAVGLQQYADMRNVKQKSVSEMLEKYYAEKNDMTRIRQRSADLRHITVNAVERVSKKYDIQAAQLKDTDKMDKYRIYGELINTYGYSVPEGASSFEAVNYYTGENVTVPLDPCIDVSANSKRYFERYQKLKRTKEAVSGQIKESAAELEHLKSIQNSLDIAAEEADLSQIADELASSGYMKKRNGKIKERVKSIPFHYRSSDGYDIYVGKNNYQNDELTFKMATGNDWWFHSKKFPGSHVLLKVGNGDPEAVPDRAFNEAGRLAAFYSSGRGQEKVEIDYTLKKNVKKPAGAAPGFVVYYTNYSMAIESSIDGIEEIKKD